MRDEDTGRQRCAQHNGEAVRALAAHQSLLKLVQEGAPDARALARLAVPMTETDFLNMCEERSLAFKCGNPLCTEAHRHQASHDSARIDWNSLAILKVSVDQHWCSKTCHIKCAQFAKSLGNAMDRLDVLQKLKAGPSVLSHHGSENQHDKDDAMINGILGSVQEHPVAKSPVPNFPTHAVTSPATAADSRVHSGGVPCTADRSGKCAPSTGQNPVKDNRRSASGDAAKDKCMSGSATVCRRTPPARRRSRAAELMRDMQRSLQSPVMPADADDFDFTDSGSESGNERGAEPHSGFEGDAPEGTEATPRSDRADSADGSHAARGNALQHDISTGGAVIPPAQCASDGHPAVQLASAAVNMAPVSAACAGVRDPGTVPASYVATKGRFKPRVPKPGPKQTTPDASVSIRSEPASTSHAHGLGGSLGSHVPTSRPSSGPSTADTSAESMSSEARLGARPGRKRVTFSSCQMLEFDPELPPAESREDDCVCEVPLLPAATSGPIQVFPHSLASDQVATNVGPAWDGFGHPADLLCSSDEHAFRVARSCAVEGVSGLVARPSSGSSSPRSAESEDSEPEPDGAIQERNGDTSVARQPATGQESPGSRAVAADPAHGSEVTPVLYFDMHAQKSAGEMEGALRVTTAEALQLSAQDLAELHAQMDAGRGTGSEGQLDVQAGDVESSDDGEPTDAEDPASDEEPPATAGRMAGEGMRRPRLRRRRQAEAAVEIRQECLSAEQQHQLNRQAIADAFRYYLAPEAGGVGVAANGAALHELASDLGRRAARPQGGPSAAGRDTQLSSPHGDGRLTGVSAAAELQGPDNHLCGRQAGDGGSTGFADTAEAALGLQTVDPVDGGQLSGGDSESCASSWTSESTHGEMDDAPEVDCASPQHGNAAGSERDQPATGNGASVDGYFDAAASAKPRLSAFGIAWRLLGAWACQETVLHLHKPGLHAAQCFPEHTRQGQRALTSVLLKRVAPLLECLRVGGQVPVAQAEREIDDVLATLDVRFAVPTMALPVQDSLVLVLLAAVARHRMPQMADALQTGSPRMVAALEQAELTPELFDCLLDCLIDSA